MKDNELMHYGVLCMKWGVRRYQNRDGTLTSSGKKKALKLQNNYTELIRNHKYRDSNGNLTYAGRKKALKLQTEYSDITGKKRLVAFSNKNTNTNTNNTASKVKTKKISEMSNAEIQAKIDRIRLENTLRDLTPKQVSKGEKFVNGLKDASVSILKERGTKIAGDMFEKKMREALGLSGKDKKSASKILEEKAKEYENRVKIDRAQEYFKNKANKTK